MRANFDEFRQNATKSSEKRGNFKGHESGTNFPLIFEDGIVLTCSKFRPRRRYTGPKFTRIFERYFEISVGQCRIFEEQFDFSIAGSSILDE